MTTWNCDVCRRPGGLDGVLGVAAHEAGLRGEVRWRSVHPDCFAPAGLSYGVSFDDIKARGVAWWLEHVGQKAWAEHTDYRPAFTRAGAA